MLSVFICEDDPGMIALITKIVERHRTINNLALKIVCTEASAVGILSYLEKNSGLTGLYLLDIALGSGKDGLDLARDIRTKHDPRGFITLITADPNLVLLALKYYIEPLEYIVKDCDDFADRICKCIDNAMGKFTAKATPLQDTYVFKTSKDIKMPDGFKLAKDSTVTIDKNKILYFKTNPDMKRTIFIKTTDGDYECNGKLISVALTLGNGHFYKCQQNLIVNLDKIIAVDPVQCVALFSDGCKVKIANVQVKKLARRIEEHRSMYK